MMTIIIVQLLDRLLAESSIYGASIDCIRKRSCSVPVSATNQNPPGQTRFPVINPFLLISRFGHTGSVTVRTPPRLLDRVRSTG